LTDIVSMSITMHNKHPDTGRTQLIQSRFVESHSSHGYVLEEMKFSKIMEENSNQSK
jgi:hypothetical protein